MVDKYAEKFDFASATKPDANYGEAFTLAKICNEQIIAE
jgi:hypothetical protein